MVLGLTTLGDIDIDNADIGAVAGSFTGLAALAATAAPEPTSLSMSGYQPAYDPGYENSLDALKSAFYRVCFVQLSG